MFHLVARSSGYRLVFSDWEEGVRLWDTVVGACPGLVALCVMPDHVHVLVPNDVRSRLGLALGGYARWRNARREERGTLWAPLPDAERLADAQKVRRSVRYVHLNPCRAGLVADPLGWPLSTHLDAVGLVARPVRRRAPDVLRFHAYVSGDPSAKVQGTELPVASTVAPDVGAVLDAVSVVARQPVARLGERGPARMFAIRALRTLTPARAGEIAVHVGASRPTVARVKPGLDADLRLVERWAGDPRCSPLDDGVLLACLHRSGRWRNYRR